ncbi:hypothetical protein DFH06DRAFT_981789 [Mycena polygramma]|nr:hypothetical protein DFH06DRAFT_981789 [Mycena polygramma]
MLPLRTPKPQFDESNPLSLRRYFEDVDELCESHYTNPTSELKIKRALYYTPDPRTEDLWKGYNTPGTQWDAFKTKIMRLYPGSDGGFWCSDLEQFVVKSAQGEWGSQEDVGKYYREFSTIANRLLEDEQLTSGDVDAYYRQGVPPEFWKRIESHFRAIGRHARAYPREDVYEAALWVSNEKRKMWRR